MLVANEETMGVAAEPGSHVRRKWLHVIQVRTRVGGAGQ